MHNGNRSFSTTIYDIVEASNNSVRTELVYFDIGYNFFLKNFIIHNIYQDEHEFLVKINGMRLFTFFWPSVKYLMSVIGN